MRYLLLLLVGFLCSGCLPLMAQQPSSSVRMMTFNIRYDNPQDGKDAWPHRKEWVAELVREQRVDVVGFQEALPHQVEELVARLPAYAWYGVGREDGQRRGEFAPLFFLRDRWEPLGTRTFWLSTTPDEAGSRGWDAGLPRIATEARLRDRKTGAVWTIWNTHLDHRGAEARLESARLLVERAQAAPAGDRRLIMGDMNCTPVDPPYDKFLSAWGTAPGLRDARQASETPPAGPDATWCGFHEVVPGMRIDHIFVDPQVRVLEYAIIIDQREGRFPSDHLPVLVTLRAD